MGPLKAILVCLISIASLELLFSYLQNLMQVRIIKFDVNEEVQIRNSDGLCIECDFDEAGEAVGKIPDDGNKWQI